MHAKWIIVAALCLASVATVAADDSDIVLKGGPDAALTTTRCSVCHSADYIEMNSVFLNKAGWTAEVNKMVKAYGAPIPEDEAAKIVAYLAQYYGAQ